MGVNPMMKETDYADLVKDIGEIVKGFSGLADIALPEYKRFADDVVSERITNINEIEYRLDFMLDFCFDNRVLLLYKKVLRHLYHTYPDTVKSYVDAYYDMYGADETNNQKRGKTMLWYELFNNEKQPTENQIKKFVNTPLWDDLANYLQETYNVKPKYSYSNCSMNKGSWKGWNVKFQKSSKTLCTLYPKPGFFMALIPLDGTSKAIKLKSKKSLNEVKSIVALRAETLKKSKN
jgi:hypothetical protein